MATQLNSSTGAGIQYDLSPGGSYLVAEGTRIISTGADALSFTSASGDGANPLSLTISGYAGSYTQFGDAVLAGGAEAADSVFIHVTRTGVLNAPNQGTGINTHSGSLSFSEIRVLNDGTVSGGDFGMYLASSVFVSLVNNGTIIGGKFGITCDSGPAGTCVIRNNGHMVGGTDPAIYLDAANGQIFNKGLISGDVKFYDGNDLYDGRGGKVIGLIDGEKGNDRFLPGAARDSIVGGDGEDVLDFRSSRGVNVALDNAFAKTGVARGDTYTGIENLRGSLTGADKLRGDAQGNDLFGYGGADTLVGAAGNDFLNGGLGRDRLSGGGGSDVFVFNSLRERGDTITDFAGGFALTKDSFFINLKGFGLSGSTFKQGWYREGNSNVAQDRDDHFLFRKTDTTLWFDADGRGGRGPVLLANLQAGAELDGSQFNLINA